MPRDIPERESLTIEFKSDRDRLSDRELIAAVICLANTEGGEIYLGVEDDGNVTGLHPVHQNLTGLTALIANLTSPPLTARVEAIDLESRRIAKVSAPLAPESTRGLDNPRTTSGRPDSTRFSRNRWSFNSPGTMGKSREEMQPSCAGSAKIRPADS